MQCCVYETRCCMYKGLPMVVRLSLSNTLNGTLYLRAYINVSHQPKPRFVFNCIYVFMAWKIYTAYCLSHQTGCKHRLVDISIIHAHDGWTLHISVWVRFRHHKLINSKSNVRTWGSIKEVRILASVILQPVNKKSINHLCPSFYSSAHMI